MADILITGGTGFIGSHLTKKALDKNFRVTVTYFSDDEFAIDLPMDDVIIRQLDVADREQVQDVIQDSPPFEYVVNAAGYIDHTPFSDGGRELFEQHLNGVVNLVDALDWDPLERFVQIGSSDEYGGTEAPQAESDRESPIAPYSAGKASATHFLQMLHRTENFPGVIARIFLAYGPGQSDDRFLPQIIQACLRGEKFPTSEGKQVRDFCFVKDVADGIFSMLDTAETNGEVINLGSGEPVSVRSVVELVVDIIGRGEPLFGEYPYRDLENMELYPELSKARSLFDWEATTELQEGLTKTIDFYREQRS